MKQHSNSRGQAAMEFIMTYGWAILVVMVMIGALAYFGVMNPNKYLPDKCLFGTGFQCGDYLVQNNNGNLLVNFTLTNKIGDSILIQTFNVSAVTGTGTHQSNCGYAAPDNNNAWQPDVAKQFNCGPLDNGVSGAGTGQPAKITVAFSYIKVTGKFPQTISGIIQTTTQ